MKRHFTQVITWGVALFVAACQQVQMTLLPEEEEKLTVLEERMEALVAAEPDEIEDLPRNTYAHFVSHHGYPRNMIIYHDDAEMAKATMENAHIVISLYHQRGRLYVDDKVVADWPVSTGVEGRATTPGQYTVLEKKKEHSSRRFGSIKGPGGNTLVGDADSRKHKVPAGATWVGSPMPNWMRLTDYGMGMHTGVVQAGTCLSHGCIRMPDFIAARLFDLVEVGFPVTVSMELEPEYPALDVLFAAAPYNTWLYEKKILQKEIDSIIKKGTERAKAEAEAQLQEPADAAPESTSEPNLPTTESPTAG